MPTKRKLADLYVRGKSCAIDDGSGEPVVVWLQKLSPVDMEKAVRRANAYRARLLAESRDETSETYLSVRTEIDRMSRDELLDAVAQKDIEQRAAAIEAEIETDERWSKDNYLQGLQDAWNDGMRERYALDPDDPDAKRVLTGLQEFTEFVSERLEAEKTRVKNELSETRSEEQLRKRATEEAIESRVDLLWMAEFRRCQVWLAVRENEGDRTYYFRSRDEVDELAQETLVQLIRGYTELEVDVVEGKGSGVTPPSSPSPEQETEEHSSPEASAA